MERTKVNSSSIVSTGYDTETRKLQIEFTSGGIYEYSNVPEEVYKGLLEAGSKGTYLHEKVLSKRDEHPYVCLNPRPRPKKEGDDGPEKESKKASAKKDRQAKGKAIS